MDRGLTKSYYTFDNGWSARREFNRRDTNQSIDGKWILRNKFGYMVDNDNYPDILFKRHNLIEKL